MIIHTQVVSDFQQNARVILDPKNKVSCIIDPGADEQKLFNIATQDGLVCKDIFLTHCHIDHAGAVKRLLKLFSQNKLSIPALIYHSEGQLLANHIETAAQMYGMSGYENVPPFNTDLKNQQVFKIGNHEAKCLYTPGHAPGHVALYFENLSEVTLSGDFAGGSLSNSNILIAGDALFRGSIGRTDLPGGNHDLLIEKIKTELFTLPEDTIVLSGHGPNTLIGNEKKTNPFFN